MSQLEEMLCATVQTELLAALRKRRYRTMSLRSVAIEAFCESHAPFDLLAGYRFAPENDDFYHILIKFSLWQRIRIQLSYCNDQPCVIGRFHSFSANVDPIRVELHDEDWCSKFMTALDKVIQDERRRCYRRDIPFFVAVFGIVGACVITSFLASLPAAMAMAVFGWIILVGLAKIGIDFP